MKLAHTCPKFNILDGLLLGDSHLNSQEYSSTNCAVFLIEFRLKSNSVFSPICIRIVALSTWKLGCSRLKFALFLPRPSTQHLSDTTDWLGHDQIPCIYLGHHVTQPATWFKWHLSPDLAPVAQPQQHKSPIPPQPSTQASAGHLHPGVFSSI